MTEASLPEILEKIRRPLEYASRQNFQNFSNVRGLDESIPAMVLQALELSEDPGKTELLRELKLLFLSYSEEGEEDQRRRVVDGLKIVDALLGRKEADGGERERESEPRETQSHSHSHSHPGQSGSPTSETVVEAGEGETSSPPSTSQTKKKRRRRRGKKKASEEEKPNKAEAVTPQRVTDALAKLEEVVTNVKGVGPKTQEMLERLGIQTVEDLLYTLPRDYQDRRLIVPIGKAAEGEMQTFSGRIAKAPRPDPKGRRPHTIVISDGSGELQATWFHYQSRALARFETDQQVVLSGKVALYKGQLQVAHPEIEIIDEEGDAAGFARLVPIYPLTEGLTQNAMRRFVSAAMEQYSEYLVGAVPGASAGLAESLRQLHDPGEDADAGELSSGMTDAHRLLAYDELFALQLGLTLRRHAARSRKGIAYEITHSNLAKFRTRLPFELTNGQERALDDIKRDMMAPRPMHRLLQGDVGTGKTVVALMAALIAVDNGRQVAIMAPTELVAEQHYALGQQHLERVGVKTALLSGSVRPTERDGLYPRISKGAVDIVFGTHALLSEGVQFKKLGLVIIDEQHRFGVEQRATLRKKGAQPDVLVMTATPIPRSLALTVFGDLDISAITEAPPGRKPVETVLLMPEEREEAYGTMRKEVSAGRQAYVVYPTIDSSALEIESAKDAFRRLSEDVFPDFKLALLHGRLSRDEKEGVVDRFRKGSVDIVVATTVVGVGVDVPNATVMVIEGADRFGLSDLHQLRGRVGRGADQSFCYLVPREDSADDSIGRLSILEGTTDGFKVAEADLITRGFGDLAGIKQAGLPTFRVTDLARDTDLLMKARDDAQALVSSDPRLRRPPNKMLPAVLKHRWGDSLELADVG